ncbi:MAG: GNAT family N-acetyltransferase [Rhodoluna sp.]
MSLEIRRLSVDERGPLVDFMDGPAFKSQPQWQGCYCQFYLNTAVENADPAAKTGLNREKACDRITAGTMQGYLAFDGERAIGWMAANSANNFVALPPTGQDVARILCFVVEQEFQGGGVATALLNFALTDLPKQGFVRVEAAPKATEEFSDAGYRGPLSMFRKAGFTVGPNIDGEHVLVHRELTF